MANQFNKFWMVWRLGGGAPTFQHYSKESAENEAVRLALKEPGAKYFVLKAVSGFQADLPTIQPIKLVKTDDIPF